MKNLFLIPFLAFFMFCGCVTAKSPEAVTQETSGSYKRYQDDKLTSAIIVGAYNNIEIGELKNFRESVEWIDAENNLYTMDFSDETNPLYIKGRNNIIYIAIRVAPGKYTLNNFAFKAREDNKTYSINCAKRYKASFEIGDKEVVFVGILKTMFGKFQSGSLNEAGETEVKINTVLENGKDDLYKITAFYNAVTKMPVKTNVMYWNDSQPAKNEVLTIKTSNK